MKKINAKENNYDIFFNKLVNGELTTGDRHKESFKGNSEALMGHVETMWSQGCYNVAAYRNGYIDQIKDITFKVNDEEFRVINSILALGTYTNSKEYEVSELPDMIAEYSVDCGGGFVAKILVYPDEGATTTVWVEPWLYYGDTMVCSAPLSLSLDGGFCFEAGETEFIVYIEPDPDAPKRIAVPKLVVAPSVLEEALTQVG
jgi:hypothetical protein